MGFKFIAPKLILLAILTLPLTAQIRALGLGSLSIDGDLTWQIKLGSVKTNSGVLLVCYLQHTAERTGFYSASSRWIMPVLDSSVVSFGEDKLMWLTPSGDRIVIPVLSGIFKYQGASWSVSSADGGILLESDGTSLLYRRGSLQELRGTLGRLEVIRSGRRIWIAEPSPRGTRVLIARETDASSFREQIEISEHIFELTYDENTALLRNIADRAGGMTCSLEYGQGLLAGIRMNEVSTASFTWNYTSRPSETHRQSLPVTLATEGRSVYHYKLRGPVVTMVREIEGKTYTKEIDSLFNTIRETHN